MTGDKPRDVKRWQVPGGFIYILEDYCKGCGFCYTFCPKSVLARADHFNSKGYHPPEVIDPDACSLCGYCTIVCPDFAIWTEEAKGKAGRPADLAAAKEGE